MNNLTSKGTWSEAKGKFRQSMKKPIAFTQATLIEECNLSHLQRTNFDKFIILLKFN